jgi:hypothetical protein
LPRVNFSFSCVFFSIYLHIVILLLGQGESGGTIDHLFASPPVGLASGVRHGQVGDLGDGEGPWGPNSDGSDHAWVMATLV